MMAFHVPERFRITAGMMASNAYHGNNGAFIIPLRDPNSAKVLKVRVVAADQAGWEHVSVSFPTKTPSWDVMCIVKDLFWDAEDCVVQYHPPKSDYVSFHPYCLHLWRQVGVEYTRPPSYLVGPKKSPELESEES
jgi:hypothetical protein